MHFIHKILCYEEFVHKIALFFKKLVFPEFPSIEFVSWPIEIAIKILGLVLCVSINRKLYREFFFKNLLFLMCSSLFKLFKNTFSLYSIGSRLLARFLSFPPKFLQGFSPLRPVRPFYPSFCIYFHVSCIKSCILGRMSNQWVFGILMIQAVFLKIDQWVFVIRCYITVLNGLIWSICDLWEIEISKAWMYPNWVFCSIWFILMKLACLVDWVGHFKLLSIMYNDQFCQIVGFLKMGFQILGFFI